MLYVANGRDKQRTVCVRKNIKLYHLLHYRRCHFCFTCFWPIINKAHLILRRVENDDDKG